MEEVDLASFVTNDYENCVQEFQQFGELVDTVYRFQYVRVFFLEYGFVSEDFIQEVKESIDVDQIVGKVVENKDLEKI